MVAVIGRSGWGALPPNRIAPVVDKVDFFSVHHPVTEQPTSIDESIAIAQRIQRQHLAEVDDQGKLIYSDIAYNVWAGWNCCGIGRGVDLVDGATTKTNSPPTWSVCVWGDYRRDLLTPEIRAGLLQALSLGVLVYGQQPIRPHSDFYPTDCCGSNLRDQLPGVQAELYEEEPMTPADIDALATAIADKFFSRPIELSNPANPSPTQTNIEGWFAFLYDEVALIRNKP